MSAELHRKDQKGLYKQYHLRNEDDVNTWPWHGLSFVHETHHDKRPFGHSVQSVSRTHAVRSLSGIALQQPASLHAYELLGDDPYRFARYSDDNPQKETPLNQIAFVLSTIDAVTRPMPILAHPKFEDTHPVGINLNDQYYEELRYLAGNAADKLEKRRRELLEKLAAYIANMRDSNETGIAVMTADAYSTGNGVKAAKFYALRGLATPEAARLWLNDAALLVLKGKGPSGRYFRHPIPERTTHPTFYFGDITSLE